MWSRYRDQWVSELSNGPIATYGLANPSRADGHGQPFMSRLDLSTLQPAQNAVAHLAITNYTGITNEVTEPSVYFNPNGFGGFRYWMCAGPYPNANNTYENPSIWCSNDGQAWIVPPGVTNPLVPAPAGGGNNADPHLIEVKGTLYLVYCAENLPGVGDNINVISSTDGVTWTAPALVLNTSITTGHQAQSPCPYFDGTTWHLWVLDQSSTPLTFVYRSATAITGPWSAPTTTNMVAPAGKKLWEMEVKRFADEWHMLICVTDTASSATGGQLHFATSIGAVNWTMTATPLLTGAGGGWDVSIYKATFVHIQRGNTMALGIWYSSAGGTGGNSWWIGYTTATFGVTPATDLQKNAMNILASLKPIAPYVLGDTFDRADAAVMGTSDSGATYTVWAGVPGISGKQAYASTAANTKAVTTALADGYSEITVATNDSAGYLVFRGTDTSNYWRFGFTGSSGANVALQKVVAGAVTTLIGPLANMPVGTRFGVLHSGSSISIYTNGILRATVTDAFNQSAILVGFQSQTLATRLDNLWSRALVNGL